jgi:hypothetical protein
MKINKPPRYVPLLSPLEALFREYLTVCLPDRDLTDSCSLKRNALGCLVIQLA